MESHCTVPKGIVAPPTHQTIPPESMPRLVQRLNGPGNVQGLKRRVANSPLENARQRLIRSGNISAQALDILS